MGEAERCPYCDVTLVLDSETMEWVCPMCGTVYDYEMVPPIGQSSRLVARRRLDPEVVRLAEEIFGSEIPAELKRMRKRRLERLIRTLDSLIKRREYDVDWEAIREAVEVARTSGLEVSFSEIRAAQVLKSIATLVESCCPGVSADDVYAFAARHRDLWSGRKPDTIATVFTYLFVKLKLKEEPSVPMKPSLRKLAKIFERVLVERGEA